MTTFPMKRDVFCFLWWQVRLPNIEMKLNSKFILWPFRGSQIWWPKGHPHQCSWMTLNNSIKLWIWYYYFQWFWVTQEICKEFLHNLGCKRCLSPKQPRVVPNLPRQSFRYHMIMPSYLVKSWSHGTCKGKHYVFVFPNQDNCSCHESMNSLNA